MRTWQETLRTQSQVITIVGMAKNVGKTVTLNYVQGILQDAGYTLGLTSIGRDGETLDALTNLEKPRIVVQQGTIVATAEKMIADKKVWDYLQATDFVTPLGKVILLRAKSINKVVLAGPSKNSEVKDLLAYLTAWGAQSILIDGAFDRQSSADPMVSSKVILACGATVSRDLSELILLTKSRVEQLTLPPCDDFYRTIAEKTQAKVVTVRSGRVTEVSYQTSLLLQSEWREVLGTGCDAVIIKGAVSDSFAQSLLLIQNPPHVIVQDGSKVFITAAIWRQLRARIMLSVLQPIELLGITMNPTYPGGMGYDAEVLLQEMGRALAPLPVVDIMREAK